MDIDVTFSRLLLRSATALVHKHFPQQRLRDAWAYHFHLDHWEFHGPEGFYWNGRASCAYEARYHGWMAWLAENGVDTDTVED